jgi:hypothetical protein
VAYGRETGLVDDVPPGPGDTRRSRLLNGAAAKVFYSLHHLLPIVTLDRAYDDVALRGGVRYYFYAHKLLDWALGSFLVAGLAGLTQGR